MSPRLLSRRRFGPPRVVKEACAKRDEDTNRRRHGRQPRFEAKLWAAADALRNNMDAAEYKHVVLGLIFLKYISEAFEAKHAELEAQKAQGADPKTATSTALLASSGYRKRLAGSS